MCFVGECGPGMAVNRHLPNIGPRISILNRNGKRVGRLGSLLPGMGPGEMQAPHGIAVDSHGDIYLGEVSWTNWPTFYPDKPRPAEIRSLHKFRKITT